MDQQLLEQIERLKKHFVTDETDFSMKIRQIAEQSNIGAEPLESFFQQIRLKMDQTLAENAVVELINLINQLLEKDNVNVNAMVIRDNANDSWFLIQFLDQIVKKQKKKLIIFSPCSGYNVGEGLHEGDIVLINEMFKDQFGNDSAMGRSTFDDSIKVKKRKNELVSVLAGGLCLGMGHNVAAFKAAIREDNENTKRVWEIIFEILKSGQLPSGSAEDVWKLQ